MTRPSTTTEKAPHSPEAEQAVLAAALNHPKTAADLLAVAGVEDFWGPRVRSAMRVVAGLVDAGIPPEPITVSTRVAADSGWGLADLTALVVDAPSDAGALDAARVVARHAAERRAMAVGAELVEAARQGRLAEVLTGIGEELASLHPASAVEDGRGKVDWQSFWSQDRSVTDWLVEPFLVRGRSHALYAPGKAGKSLFVLAVAAALATGRASLRRGPGDPVRVAYFDFEMTEDDLQERLGAMGYDETSDLSRLSYYLLPNLAPLDTPEGGREMAQILTDDRPEVVIVDTTARAISGEENSADTIRDYFRHTGVVLKRAGVTSLRVDHAGKDLTRGQRGSSAKNDDVDIVWQLTPAEGGITLRATHRRLGWVPETVDYRRNDEPVLSFEPAPALWPSGTAEVADLLDRHDVPLDASVRVAGRTLRDLGEGRRQALVRAGLKWRRDRLEEAS